VAVGGRPIIGRVSNTQMGEDLTDMNNSDGVYIAVGHGAWGISQSLGTGLVVTELVNGKKPSADVSGLGLK
jgi:glycine/D-amino acid oxidase-like deaminating enzyme